VSVAGDIDIDNVLDAVGKALLSRCLQEKRSDDDLLRQIAHLMRTPKFEWPERLEFLTQHVLAQCPVVLLLDNFEDNLDDHRTVPGELGEFLTAWLEQPGQSRLLFTCRYPFQLPDDAQDTLDPLHLGPLSLAETRKLLWRLKGLDQLDSDEIQRAYEQVGGHPRALEYLDALLRGGQARFKDVEKRLKAALRKNNIDDPKKWCAATQNNLDAALAETVTLATDDVLLGDLLAWLESDPLAQQLLLGAAVYRLPVDEIGLVWTVGEPLERQEDPELKARVDAAVKIWNQAIETGEEPDRTALGMPWDEFVQADAARRQPPIAAPDGFAAARATLEALSLLAPFQLTDDEPLRYTVHRWTAGALARRFPEAQTEAHRRAARYWDWRFDTLPQSEEQDVEDFLEARFHYHAAGEIESAVEVTEFACSQLETWGAWSRVARLYRETLNWVPDRSPKAAMCFHQLGILAQNRGDLDEALAQYRRSLAIKEALGNRAGMAGSCCGIGAIFTETGKPEDGLDLNLRSLAIYSEIGSPDVRFNWYWLTRQRTALGERRFVDILRQHLDEESVNSVLEMLEAYAAAQSPDEAGSQKRRPRWRVVALGAALLALVIGGLVVGFGR